MHFVLTINQRDTREVGDQVPELLRSLRHIPAAVPFQRSVGDEAQGILADPAAAIDAALTAVRARRWHVGLGIGEVLRPLSADVMQAEGFGLVYARRAVERAQRTGDRIPLAVEGPDAQVAEIGRASCRERVF